MFKILPIIGDPGYYYIFAKHSGKCLDVRGASKQPGANVDQYPCHGGLNQRFKIERISDDPGFYKISSKNSGLVFDISGASKNDGANLIQYTWHGGDNQRFSLVPVMV